MTHPAKKFDQVDIKIKDMGYSYIFKKKFIDYGVSPGTKHKRGVKSRVKKLSVTRNQNSMFFLEVDPIPFLGLDLIDPWSSFNIEDRRTDGHTDIRTC